MKWVIRPDMELQRQPYCTFVITPLKSYSGTGSNREAYMVDKSDYFVDGRVHYIKVYPVDENGKPDYSSYEVLRLPLSAAHKLRDMIKQYDKRD